MKLIAFVFVAMVAMLFLNSHNVYAVKYSEELLLPEEFKDYEDWKLEKKVEEECKLSDGKTELLFEGYRQKNKGDDYRYAVIWKVEGEIYAMTLVSHINFFMIRKNKNTVVWARFDMLEGRENWAIYHRTAQSFLRSWFGEDYIKNKACDIAAIRALVATGNAR